MQLPCKGFLGPEVHTHHTHMQTKEAQGPTPVLLQFLRIGE